MSDAAAATPAQHNTALENHESSLLYFLDPLDLLFLYVLLEIHPSR